MARVPRRVARCELGLALEPASRPGRLLAGLASSPIFPGSAAPCPVVGAFICFICFFFAFVGVWTVVVACANCIPSTRAVLSLHAEAPSPNPRFPQSARPPM